MAWGFGERMTLVLDDAGANYKKHMCFDISRGPGMPDGHITEYSGYYLFLHGDHSVAVQKNDANVGVLMKAYLKGYEEFEEAVTEWRGKQ